MGAVVAWGQQSITRVSIEPAAQATQLVFGLSGPAQYKLFTLDNPRRVVVDFQETREAHSAVSIPADAVVTRMRTAVQPGHGVRVVFDLRVPASASASLVPADGSNGSRLVVNLKHAAQALPGVSATVKTSPTPAAPPVATRSTTPVATVVAAPVTTSPATVVNAAPPQTDPFKQKDVEFPAATVAMAGRVSVPPIVPAAPAEHRPKDARDVIVAIDAGHGGDDPGALGPNGTREKNVTLAIARSLADELGRQTGVQAKLVRTGDYFIPLKSRRDIARTKLNADLFVSIHADAALSRQARGASVFALSRNGATSSLAQMLAERENQADLVGGALQEKDDMVASVIADLALEGAMEHSMKVGGKVMKELGGVTAMHKRYIEKAGFAVLKSADFPSILVETGFISNPSEEAALRNPLHQQKLARAIARGVMGYFGDHPPPSTYVAWLRDSKGGVKIAPSTLVKTVPGDTVAYAPTKIQQKSGLPPKPVAGKTLTGPKAASRPVATPKGKMLAKTSTQQAKVAVRGAAKRASHRIARGETLAEIASKYRVALADLRRANAIRNDNLIRIGQVLTIPDT